MSLTFSLTQTADRFPVTAVASDTLDHLRYTTLSTPVGTALLASSSSGLRSVRLGLTEPELLAGLEAEFPSSVIERDDDYLASASAWLLEATSGYPPASSIPLDVRGTKFQRAVWHALCEIPVGQTRSYTEVATAIGQPLAVRAVGSACGANHVAIFVPCHRVVGSDGSLGGYRWGSDVKQKLLEAEAHAQE